MNCDSPYYVLPSKAAVEKIPVPCGKCPLCKARRVNQWVFRCMEQEKVSESSHFITLTYDTRYVPISKHGHMTLNKEDLQNYWKRLRKLCPGKVIKYYAVGEYGSKTARPHYHAVVFNVPDPEMFAKAWSIDGNDIGAIHVGTVTSDSVAYTMKYIDKPPVDWALSAVKIYRDDRQKEFSCMSKGLGKSYLSDAVVEYHKADLSRLYVTKHSGHRVAMPRYYRDKIFTDQEKKQQVQIIQSVVEQQELELRRIHYDFNGRLPFELAQENARYARHRQFYHTFNKKRDTI